MANVKVEFNVPVPMRDGTVLRADVFRPDTAGQWPVILRRTPYGKHTSVGRWELAAEGARRGYAVVVQDCRGRYASDGEFVPFLCDVEDGYDTVEWCAAQDWSNGRVGLVGQSYNGATQLLAGISGPPHLRCMFPTFTSSDHGSGWVYKGGSLFAAFLYAWTVEFLAIPQVDRAGIKGEAREQRRAALHASMDRLKKTLGGSNDNGLSLIEDLAPYYRTWLEHGQGDAYWQRFSISGHIQNIGVPVFNGGGWYDLFREGPPRNYEMLRGAGGEYAGDHRLCVGPWVHSSAMSYVAGQRSFGRAAQMDFDQLQWIWYDRWLRDNDHPWFDDPAVNLFVMGRNEWRAFETWPPPGEVQPWYLHSSGRANSLEGDGTLDRDEPSAEPPDVYLYNPRDPVPTIGAAGVFDQRPVEARRDVLVYTSKTLTSPLDVVGNVAAELHAATSAEDTDFVARLVDVSPDGYAANIAEGVLRVRYRDSFESPAPAEPGCPYLLRIDLGPIAHSFRSGHRIRLEIASSHFPRWERHRNVYDLRATGHVRTALQTVFHEETMASRILLPVVHIGE